MSGRITPLEWDSEFFGVPIGRADLDGVSGPDDLAEVDEEARDLGLTCLYGRIDSSRIDELGVVGHSSWYLVDVSIVLARRPADPFDVSRAVGTARRGTPADLVALHDAIDRLAPWSRFAVDPHFGVEPARRLVHRWLERAADPASEDWELVVVEDGGDITSFCTLHHDEHPRIDLIGATVPGSGSTDALMAHVLAGAADDERILGGPIAVRNVHALRYSERCGYVSHRCHYSFHRWYGDADGGGVR